MNGDIDPPSTFVEAHAALAPLIANAQISERFGHYDRRAVLAKQIYNLLGGVGLFAVFVAMGALIYELTLPKHFGAPEALPGLAAVAGAIGLMAQLILLLARVKDRWLLARFAAERIRGVKFEAFRAAAAGGVDTVEPFIKDKIGALELQLRTGRGAYRAFDPEATLAESPEKVAGAAVPLDELQKTYQELRVDYQVRHAASQIDRLSEERKLPASLSEVSFWLAALVTFVDALLALPAFEAWGGTPTAEALRHFAALMLFVGSAILFVYQRGRADAAAIERYEEYRRTLSRLTDAIATAANADIFIEAVGESELAVLQELRSFAREAEASTYVF